MATIGTPLSATATRLLLLGSGELGKEVAIEAQRLGVEVIAVDRYANAPAMQVAHRSHVINMLDGVALRAVIEREQPPNSSSWRGGLYGYSHRTRRARDSGWIYSLRLGNHLTNNSGRIRASLFGKPSVARQRPLLSQHP